MDKDRIKHILREAFVNPISEEEQAQNQANAQKFDKDYAEVQNKLTNTMLKQSQVMAAAGLGNPNDATDRSLFSKKVHKEKNDEGGLYQFDHDELGSVIKVLNNPAAYLNVKNKANK